MVNIKQSISALAVKAIDWFAPHSCLYCRQASQNGTCICEYCEIALEPNTACCPSCALPYTGGDLCTSCLAAHQPLNHISAPYVYNRATAALMHAWKYQKSRHLTQTVASLMLKAAITQKNYDIAIAAPLHWRRRLQRGFNQSEDLLAALQRQGGLPTSTIASRPFFWAASPRLKRLRYLPPQAQLSRSARLKQMNDVFSVRGNISDKSVLVIDDVCTTGATGNAMAKALRGAGAKEVHLWCLARTPAS